MEANFYSWKKICHVVSHNNEKVFHNYDLVPHNYDLLPHTYEIQSHNDVLISHNYYLASQYYDLFIIMTSRYYHLLLYISNLRSYL